MMSLTAREVKDYPEIMDDGNDLVIGSLGSQTRGKFASSLGI